MIIKKIKVKNTSEMILLTGDCDTKFKNLQIGDKIKLVDTSEFKHKSFFFEITEVIFSYNDKGIKLYFNEYHCVELFMHKKLKNVDFTKFKFEEIDLLTTEEIDKLNRLYGKQA